MIGWLVVIFGGYWFISMIPCGVCLIILSLGSEYRMGFIDEQLSNKKVNIPNLKPYAKAFYDMTSYAIGSRFIWYSIAYPLIRHRAVTKSKKFKFMMWLNCSHAYSFIAVFILMTIDKYLFPYS
jgi:hypothetical protein